MQLTLPVSLPINQTFDSYFCDGDNGLVSHLKSLPDKQSDVPLTVLSGLQGTGKSHLMFALCHLADSLGLGCVYINVESPDSLDPAVFDAMEQHLIICIDNIDALADKLDWETALFDLINRVMENSRGSSQVHLVLSSRNLPKFVGFSLPDLLSRLQWGMIFKLREPTDEQRRHIVALRAKQKGLELSDSACAFLLSHANRHLPILMDIIEELDALSLQAKKKITVPMLKQVLED